MGSRELFLGILIFWLIWLAVVLHRHGSFEWLAEKYDSLKKKFNQRRHGEK
ncbi:hypothetical protein NE619_05725 [Anaerovorax odorimutans]|uniref:Uncharacterized protein n=1 Tax=Anaerovorax odorimutans TaxID=109327 RepID=A0ABT1RM05_9FIRM|nr:hypothetical protein [Anaerovorax odorimutans]MCQ4636220.1 hypothetical protein [Anaerovorax odorimutans]